jgi:hypothetical protein
MGPIRYRVLKHKLPRAAINAALDKKNIRGKKMKINYYGGVVSFDENGQYETDIVTSLPHRLDVVDGVVVDKYPGKTDNEVKQADHEAALERLAQDRAEWDKLDDEIKENVERPADLPELDLPEEE